MDRQKEILISVLLFAIGVVPLGIGAYIWSLPAIFIGITLAVAVLPSAYRLLRFPSLRQVSAGDVAKNVRQPHLLPLAGGMLVAFSGIDGSGKTTQADRLVESLKEQGVPAVRVWARWRPIVSYPFMGFLYMTRGWRRKDYAKISIIKRIWAYLVLIDQCVFALWNIWPHLLRGRVVCIDRYLVDQVVELKFDGLYNPNCARLFSILLPMPDETFVLDVPVTEAIERKDDTGEMLDRLGIDIDVKSYLNRRRSILLETATELEATVIDTTHPISETHAKIREKTLRRYFSSK